ncbi:MAG: etfB, partial [Acidimicrobiales bacterium]|nr:etfB [Acidimicrobiales bacterium]
FKGIMAAKSKPVDNVTVADLGLDASIVGWAGAGQEIVDVAAAPEREAGEVIEDDGESFQKIVAFLDGLKVL